MNTPASSALQSLVTAAILDALAIAKQNDFAGAMTRLAVAPAMLAEAEFREQLLALHRALNPAFDSGPQAAAGDFQRCSALIDAIGLPEVSASLAIERDLSFGFASVQAGDPGGALRYYHSAIARAEQLRLAYPEAWGFVARGRMGANLAQFNIAVGLGQLDQAEICAGSILQLQRDIEQHAADAGAVSPGMIVDSSATAVEITIFFVEQDMNALDYAAARRRLAAAANAAARIAPNQTAAPSVAIPILTQTMAALFTLMNKLAEVASAAIGKREPVSGATLQALDQLYDLLFEVERLAAQTGERGGRMREMIRRMHRLADNLTNIARPQAGGIATRYAGPLFGLSLLVLGGGEYALIGTNAVVWPLMMLGDLIAALIIAFGYGAVQFVSLLGVYADVLGKSKQGPT